MSFTIEDDEATFTLTTDATVFELVPSGHPGPRGFQGDTGLQGSQGIQGVKGDKGDTGSTGPQGSQGIQGVQGIQGNTGSTGSTGAAGGQIVTTLVGDGSSTDITVHHGFSTTAIIWSVIEESTGIVVGNPGAFVTSSDLTISFRIPPTTNQYRIVVMAGGASSSMGIGATGATGATGSTGATGATGATSQPAATPIAWVTNTTPALACTCDPYTVPSGSIAGTSGRANLQPIQLSAGTVVTNLSAIVGGTSGSGITHQWFVLTDSNHHVLASSADGTSSALSANTQYTKAMTSPYTITTTGLYFVGLNVAVSTTSPSWHGGQMTASIGLVGGALLGATGLTTAPSAGTDLTGTPAYSINTVYMMVS